MNKLELKIETVCEFIKSYEKEKYRIMREGGQLLSPVCFMVDYCQELRSATLNKGE